MPQVRDPHEFGQDLIAIVAIVFLLALVGYHVYTRRTRPKAKPVIEEGAAPVEQHAPELPPLVPLKTAAEVAEVEDKTQWLATVARTAHVHHDEDERLQAGPLLCDRPARPPHGSEAWLSIRLAEMRNRPANWTRLTAAIAAVGPEWPDLVTVREKAMEPTQEITEEMRAHVLGGAR